MIASLTDLVHALLSLVRLTHGAIPHDGTVLTATMLLVAAAIVAIAALVADATGRLDTSTAHPMRAMDISSPLAQSDPDASGHPRPRAPGSAATAA
ncbi:DUF6412 domain-containing protein [Microbacterium sp. 18062]|uniref:DUF6412 domain-containing protein n=1 Tax=Microbacterium sp. 18062 TaxID=2681410 RepID=UPI0013575773|nr:DUF6412 domain-containing protein [Microbacterium sp. 18062]